MKTILTTNLLFIAKNASKRSNLELKDTNQKLRPMLIIVKNVLKEIQTSTLCSKTLWMKIFFMNISNATFAVVSLFAVQDSSLNPLMM